MIGLKENLMAAGAAKLVTECGGVTAADHVAIVCDYESFGVANQVCRACLAVSAETVMVVMSPTKGHGDPPPEMVGAAMEKASIIFAITTKSISHTEPIVKARKNGSRIMTMPEFLPEMLISGAIEADFIEQRKIAEKVKALLSVSDSARLYSDIGMHLEFNLCGRSGRVVDGLAREPGSFGAPPNIEASTAPIEGSVEGTAVINASIAGIGILQAPVTLDISNGRVTSITGGADANALTSMLTEAGDEKVFMIGELGIGLNPKGTLRGKILEDESILGSVHIALGSNFNHGGTINAKRHIDCVMTGATLVIGETKLVDQGRFMVDVL